MSVCTVCWGRGYTIVDIEGEASEVIPCTHCKPPSIVRNEPTPMTKHSITREMRVTYLRALSNSVDVELSNTDGDKVEFESQAHEWYPPMDGKTVLVTVEWEEPT